MAKASEAVSMPASRFSAHMLCDCDHSRRPDSSLSALIAATILPLAAGNAERAVALAGMLAILSGLICVVAGLARFGFITELISKPIRYGYMNGIAMTVLAGQLPAFFGFSASGETFYHEVKSFVAGVIEGRTNSVAVDRFLQVHQVEWRDWEDSATPL